MTRLAVPVGSRDHMQGATHARIVLVEYGDYQCSYCGLAYPVVKELQSRFGDALAFVFRNFPLTELHPDAMRAAETAEWAGANRRFWQMHDYLFEHQHRLDRAALLAAAREMGLETRQLEVAWHDHAMRSRIAEDVASGMASGTRGTPTFFINGERYDGASDIEEMTAAIRHALT